MKRFLLVISFVFIFLVSLTSCNKIEYDVVVTNFIGYDAVRAVAQHTDTNIKMLLKPGNDIHNYEPSATDIKAVLSAKIFVYVGGESDAEWVESDILGNVKNKDIIIVNMFDVLKDRLLLEDEEDEYDEHVWTNPSNYSLIIKVISDSLIKIDNINKELYEKNTKSYLDELDLLDKRMASVINESNNKKIVVADRNPFLYFSKYYKIEILGALEGCSSDKNIPSSKLNELIKATEDNNLKAIFIIELSDGKIASDVKKEVNNDIKSNRYNGNNVEIITLYSMQNISFDSFSSGLTYNEMFKRNIDNIEYALS